MTQVNLQHTADQGEPALTTPSPHVVSELRSLVAEFGSAILVTRQRTGNLHSRPMEIGGIDGNFRIWMLASVNSSKVREVCADDRATLLFQGSSRFATLNGNVELMDDGDMVNDLWEESYHAWYDAKADRGIVSLRFTPYEAEYWDNSAASGIGAVFQRVRTYFTGRSQEASQFAAHAVRHAKLELTPGMLRAQASQI